MPSELKAGVCINYASIIIRLSTQFLLTPFVIFTLGVNEYGLFMLCNSVIAWLALTDFGLGATVSKYVVTYRAKGEHIQQAHFLGQSAILFSILGVIALVAGIGCYFFLGKLFPALNAHQQDTLKILYLLTLSNLILSFPLRPLSCVPGAYQKFIVPGLASLGTSLLNAGLTLLLLVLGYKAIGLTVLAVALGVAQLAWGLYYTIHCLGVKMTFRKPDIPLYKEMFGFSVWILLNQLMDLFYWRAGSPILANVSGALAVTLFTIGVTFSHFFMTASTAISSVLTPKLMQMVALNVSKGELTHLMIRAGRIQLFLLIIILSGFACLGQDFLRLWVGDSIGNNVHVVWLGALMVLVPLLVPLTQNTGIAILQAMNMHKGRAIILFYSSLLCVVMGYVLSLYYGVLGMFIGTAVSLTFGQIFMINVYYARKAGLHIRSYFIKTYLPILSPLFIMISCGFFVQHFCTITCWIDFFLVVASYGSFCVLLLWFFYLNRDEKEILTVPIKRIFHRK